MISDVRKVVDTMMSIPGMNENVKITTSLSRRNLLLLNSVIAKGLTGKEETGNLLENLPSEVITELIAFGSECLEKAGLTDFNEKLKMLSSK